MALLRFGQAYDPLEETTQGIDNLIEICQGKEEPKGKVKNHDGRDLYAIEHQWGPPFSVWVHFTMYGLIREHPQASESVGVRI